jgi:hypothetical protein
LREDFHTGLSGWDGSNRLARTGPAGRRSSPRIVAALEAFHSLSNYELEFLGQIDRKSMDWAFRAADLHNYYATKLVMTRPGPLPNAGLVRFVVLDGRERERVELPLPLTLERGVDYRVRVSVRGNRFLTSVNGQLISSWMDSRISRGGVGFFSEDGESSMLKWVSVSERDSFLARIASHPLHRFSGKSARSLVRPAWAPRVAGAGPAIPASFQGLDSAAEQRRSSRRNCGRSGSPLLSVSRGQRLRPRCFARAGEVSHAALQKNARARLMRVMQRLGAYRDLTVVAVVSP